MQISYKEAADIIKSCNNVHIITHQSPDGDTLGAGFALHFALKTMNIKSEVICPDGVPDRYAFICSNYQTDNSISEPEYVIAVDIADAGLMGDMRKIYENRVDLCIDHHVSNTMYASKILLNHEASATCEVMYNLFSEVGIQINDDIARCLYTGIATDTGCFKYANTTADAHKISGELIGYDINFAKINRDMFDIKSKERLYLEQHIFDYMETYFDDRCAILCITEEICEKLGINIDDLDGVAGLPLQIEGMEVAVTIKEKKSGVYKISMRSADRVNVSSICQKLGGGGHVNAAGCMVTGTLEQAKEKLLEAVKSALEE